MRFWTHTTRLLRKALIYGIGVPVLNTFDWFVARFSRVGNPPVFDNTQFPWAREVEQRWETIREELRQVMVDPKAIPSIQDLSPGLSFLSDNDGWKTYFFRAYGYRAEHNCERCPATAAILDGMEVGLRISGELGPCRSPSVPRSFPETFAVGKGGGAPDRLAPRLQTCHGCSMT